MSYYDDQGAVYASSRSIIEAIDDDEARTQRTRWVADWHDAFDEMDEFAGESTLTDLEFCGVDYEGDSLDIDDTLPGLPPTHLAVPMHLDEPTTVTLEWVACIERDIESALRMLQGLANRAAKTARPAREFGEANHRGRRTLGCGDSTPFTCSVPPKEGLDRRHPLRGAPASA